MAVLVTCKNDEDPIKNEVAIDRATFSPLYVYHRVLTMSQCEWILYESGHKFFFSSGLYESVTDSLCVWFAQDGWESQTAVLDRLEAGEYFIFV